MIQPHERDFHLHIDSEGCATGSSGTPTRCVLQNRTRGAPLLLSSHRRREWSRCVFPRRLRIQVPFLETLPSQLVTSELQGTLMIKTRSRCGHNSHHTTNLYSVTQCGWGDAAKRAVWMLIVVCSPSSSSSSSSSVAQRKKPLKTPQEI